MNAYVDADILVYRAGFATEYPLYTVVLGEDSVRQFQYKKEATAFMDEHGGTLEVTTILEPEANALRSLDGMMNSIATYFGYHNAQNLNPVLTGANNFRIDVAVTKPYKGNRTKPKPKHYDAIRERLVSVYDAYITDGEEADDYLGYAHYKDWQDYGEDASCIVTIDKDLDMIPGLHYHPFDRHEYYVDEDEADRMFLKQLLSGDDVDNIQGIKGIGEGKAEKMAMHLRTELLLEGIAGKYREAYEDKWEETMDEMAKLLWIRREPNQDWTDYWGNEWRA